MRRWFHEERPIVSGIPACSVRFVVPSTADRERGAVTTHGASCRTSITIVALLCVHAGAVLYSVGERDGALDEQLNGALRSAGFTGTIESTLERRLGRKVDPELAELGRLLWFDKLPALYHDNACGGCHSPSNGFGDTQSIAIGIQNNNLVGPDRSGPRNKRRAPLVINAAFYPSLMWNGRFYAPSRNPFDNSAGFHFPAPEGTTKFPPNDPVIKQLLQAQAHIPPTELVETAGLRGTCPTLGDMYCQFDRDPAAAGVHAETVPPPDSSDRSRNEPIRRKIVELVNGSDAYRELFAARFPEVKRGAPIGFSMLARAIAEFEFTLVFADAPIDRFARGRTDAMSAAQKRGALLFFGKARCVTCHAVGGASNEMFSDFDYHVIGVPQVSPAFGVGKGNLVQDGEGEDEDFGREHTTLEEDDRYKFRTAPLRNVAVAGAYFHNGAFTRLEDAIRHHLDVERSARRYDPKAAGLDEDLTRHVGPIEPVLERLDARLRSPIHLTEAEFIDLVAFVRDGLLDPRARRENLCQRVPRLLPSGLPPLTFQQCQT
jgi:cytochrome c peroxidase